MIWSSAFSAATRILQLVTLFLPIKVLILMSSERVPVYFDHLLNYLARKEILIFMILLVPILFVLYILFHLIANKLFNSCEASALQNDEVCSKLGAPPKRIAEYHRRIYLGLTEVVLIFFTVVLIAIIDFYLVLVLFILLVTNYLLFEELNERYPSSERLPFLNLHRDQFMEFAVAANFLLVFFGLALAVSSNRIDIFSAVLSLLAARMMFQGLQRLVKHTYMIKAIYAQGQAQRKTETSAPSEAF